MYFSVLFFKKVHGVNHSIDAGLKALNVHNVLFSACYLYIVRFLL